MRQLYLKFARLINEVYPIFFIDYKECKTKEGKIQYKPFARVLSRSEYITMQLDEMFERCLYISPGFDVEEWNQNKVNLILQYDNKYIDGIHL